MAMVSMSVIFLTYLKAMILLMPLSLLSGACFPLAARILDPNSDDPKGESIARAYSWNTIGAVVGALVAGFLVAPHYDYLNALALLAFSYGMISLAVLLSLAWRDRKLRQDRAILLLAGAAALTVIGLSAYGATGESYFVRQMEEKLRFVKVPFHKPGLQGIVTVVKQYKKKGLLDDKGDMLLVNGIGMTKKATDTKMMAHLPLLMHTNPDNVLVICFGMGTTYRSAISHGGNVTVIELVPEVFDAFPYFYSDSARILSYPKGRMIVNDGRNFLKLTRETFDVITIDPPPPIDAAGVVNLYSREFIELAKSRLRKGGIMTHWYPFYGTGSGIDDKETFMALINTFANVFPYVYVKKGYSGIGLHLMGSMEPITVSLSEIERRYKSQSVSQDLLEWDPVPLNYFSTTTAEMITGRVSEWPHLTDDNPYLEFYLLRTFRAGRQKRLPYSSWR